VQEILDGVDRGREALENMREMAEKGVKQLFQAAPPGGRGLTVTSRTASRRRSATPD